jgi:hypothetical protein
MSLFRPAISSVPPDLRPRGSYLRPPAPARPARAALRPGPALAPGPAPLTDLQLAQQQIAPLIAALTGSITAHARAASDAVRNYTGSLAQQLAGMNLGAPYQPAIEQQAGVDAALQASLQGKGNELAQGLRDKLAAIGEPGAVNPAAQRVADIGTSAGNTQLASGSAALANLIANKAGAQEYGAKLPGIAGLAGIQGVGRVQGQAVQSLAEQTAPIYGKLPDIVQNIQTNRLEQQRYQQSVQAAQQTQAARQQQLNLENRLARQKFGLDFGKTQAQIAQANARLAQGDTRLGISAKQANVAAARLAQQQLRDNRNYGVALQRIGISKRNQQLRAATQEARLKQGGFTPYEVQRLRGTALTLADQARHGFTDAKGTAHPPLSYRQAVLEGQKEGLPLSILLPALDQVGYVSPANLRKDLTFLPAPPLGG